MLRRTFLGTLLSTVPLLLASLAMVACGGGSGGDTTPPPPPPPPTGINVANAALDSAAQPNTHAIRQVTINVQGSAAIVRDVDIAVGATFLVELAPGTYAVNSIRYDDAGLLNVMPPAPFVLAEGDTPTFTAVRPGSP